MMPPPVAARYVNVIEYTCIIVGTRMLFFLSVNNIYYILKLWVYICIRYATQLMFYLKRNMRTFVFFLLFNVLHAFHMDLQKKTTDPNSIQYLHENGMCAYLFSVCGRANDFKFIDIAKNFSWCHFSVCTMRMLDAHMLCISLQLVYLLDYCDLCFI